MKTAPLLAAAGLAAALCLPLSARDAYVAVSSTAQPEYVKARSAPSAQGQPYSYVFMEGKYFAGAGHDRELAATDFHTIAVAVAQSLAGAGYLPTRDSSKANLVIVVHWGMTEVQTDAIRDFALQDLQNDLSSYNSSVAAATGVGVRPTGVNSPNGPTSATRLQPAGNVTMDLSIVNAGEGAVSQSLSYNAQLLGFAGDIAKANGHMASFMDGHTRADELLDLLNDERYFLILQAYDSRQFQKGAKAPPLWTTRVSAPAAGHGFASLLPALCGEAAQYAGRPTGQVKTDTVALN